MRGRRLERDVDYTISYDVGQVTFIDPDLLFGHGTAQVTARFEERGLFAVAPTTILGMSTRYSLGERGAINLIGLYQREQSAFNRPAARLRGDGQPDRRGQHRAPLQARGHHPLPQQPDVQSLHARPRCST